MSVTIKVQKPHPCGRKAIWMGIFMLWTKYNRGVTIRSKYRCKYKEKEKKTNEKSTCVIDRNGVSDGRNMGDLHAERRRGESRRP